MKQREFKIIVGLGNPGAAYERTYHNVGVAALRYLMEQAVEMTKIAFKLNRSKRFRYARIGNFIFVEPAVFMNESGPAVREALRFFEARPEHLAVIHDDSDLSLGTYKISFGRGSAGHRGVSSLIAALGTKEFTRIRIGITDPEESGRRKAGEFVLHSIRPKDVVRLQGVFREVTVKLMGKVKPSGPDFTSTSGN